MRISSDKFNAAINRCFLCVFALYVIKTSQRISQNVIYAESLLCLLLSLLCHVKKRTTALLMRLGTSALTVKITILTKHPEQRLSNQSVNILYLTRLKVSYSRATCPRGQHKPLVQQSTQWEHTQGGHNKQFTNDRHTCNSLV